MRNWQQVQDIFLASVDLPLENRVLVLDELCGEDGELRDEVETLLVADSGSAVTIDLALQGLAAAILDMPILIGTRLGSYRIVRELGRGGMGSVYLATRDDAEYTKEVALKVVRRGMNSVEVLRRFRDERQILANLDHPYIARLFDGGTTAEGMPFFAMEYVVGQPVDVFCREKKLDIAGRCKLFLQILEAVAYAHRHLVLHGDLKPANIFVTEDGTPKLLDFGLAKLLGPEQSTELAPTSKANPFTPGYASPEQVRGSLLNTSSDIYSLGAVLYELLAGKRAQPLDIDTPSRIQRAVCEVEVPRPGLSVRGLPADLEQVVLMALRKAPEKRYRSAGQFAEDITRCFEGRPVTARPSTPLYRAQKFLIRNRIEVLLGTLAGVALIAALLVSLAQTKRAESARTAADLQRQIALRALSAAQTAEASEADQRTQAELQRARAEVERDHANAASELLDQRLKESLQLTNRTLFDIHDAIAALPGSMAARQTIVATTLAYLQTLEKSAGDSDDLREALSAAYYKVSVMQGDTHAASLQDAAGAEQSLRKAEELLLPVYRQRPRDANLMMRWIEIQSGLSDLLNHSSRQLEAIRIDMDLLPIAHRLSLLPLCDRTCAMQEMTIENTLVYQLLPTDQELALKHATRGIELGRNLIARYPGDMVLKQELGAITAAAAGGYKGVGDLEQAAEYYRQSIQLREEILRSDPNNVTFRRGLLVSSGNYATLLGVTWSINLGRSAEARVYAARAVALARQTVSADAKDATARLDLGMSLGRLGMIDPAPGEIAASLAALEEAQGLIEPIAAANVKSADAALKLAQVMEYEAQRLDESGRRSDAVLMYRRSMLLLEAFGDAPDATIAFQYAEDEEGLGLLYASMGDVSEGLRLANKALASTTVIQKAGSSQFHTGRIAAAWATLALVQDLAGSSALARSSAEQAMQLWDSLTNLGILTIYRVPRDQMRALISSAP